MERSDPKIRWSEAVVAEKRWSGVGAEVEGGRKAGTEQGPEVAGLGWSVERIFRPLRSAPLTCSGNNASGQL